MSTVGSYLLAVSGAALLCGITDRFLSKKGAAAAARVLTSLFLVYTVLKPLNSWDGERPFDIELDFSAAAEEALAQGQMQAQKSIAELIKQETVAYILEKAQAYNADIQVTVEVSEESIPVPVGARITGNISPYAKSQLQSILEQQLGISKENQQWT